MTVGCRCSHVTCSGRFPENSQIRGFACMSCTSATSCAVMPYADRVCVIAQCSTLSYAFAMSRNTMCSGLFVDFAFEMHASSRIAMSAVSCPFLKPNWFLLIMWFSSVHVLSRSVCTELYSLYAQLSSVMGVVHGVGLILGFVQQGGLGVPPYLWDVFESDDVVHDVT